MANVDVQERDEILSKIEFKKHTERTIINKADYLKELQQVKACGCGLDMGEELTGVRCIGAPIFNQASKVAAAIWITGPAERLSDEAIQDYSKTVLASANEISEKMGFIQEQ